MQSLLPSLPPSTLRRPAIDDDPFLRQAQSDEGMSDLEMQGDDEERYASTDPNDDHEEGDSLIDGEGGGSDGEDEGLDHDRRGRMEPLEISDGLSDTTPEHHRGMEPGAERMVERRGGAGAGNNGNRGQGGGDFDDGDLSNMREPRVPLSEEFASGNECKSSWAAELEGGACDGEFGRYGKQKA